MSISGINNYTASGTGSATGASGASGRNTSLSMDDFFSLLVAQLSNQDMYNTMDDTQFISQMAQFSMVQALADLSQASATSYSVSLIGKEVVLAQTASDGTLQTKTGIVEGVTLFNGAAQVVVDGGSYDLSSVMIVKEPKIIIPDDNTVDNDSSGDDSKEDAVDGAGDKEEGDTDV